MPAWLLFIFFLLFCSCEGYKFNVTRGAQGVLSSDLFSNMGTSGTCPTRNDDRQAWCKAKNGDCSARGCCICACTYSHSTFQMKASLNTATCVENRSFRSYAGCSQTFATMDQSHPLATLDLAVRGSKGMSDKLRPVVNCKIKSAQYLDQLNWKLLGSREKSTFSIRTIRTWPYKELTWTGNMPSSYFGYIMKINGDCGRRHKWNFCVVFKANGTRSWNFPDPSTQARSVITTMSDAKTKIPTTITTTTGTMQVKSTTTVTSTTVTTIKTTSPTKAPSSKQVTTKAMTNKPSPETPKVSKSPTESSATTKSLQTEPKTGDVTAIKRTDHNPGGREPNRGGNKLSGQDDEDDSTMIAIIAGVAALICVAIVLLCVWLIISQRRKNRDAGTTVIANPRTGSQNQVTMPGLLKNPIFDDSVYAEPEERARRSAVGLIGNPSYDTTEDLLLKNPGAKDAWSMPLNNIRMKPLNTASRKIHRENTYDSTERCSRDKRQDEEKHVYHNPGCVMDGAKPVYHNPGCVIDGEKAVYQSLLKEDAHAHVNSDPNAEAYQSLDPDGLMYQSLQKNTAHKCQGDIPEYLVLLNPDEIPQNNSPSLPEYQPPYSTGPPPADIEEPPEYADYADLDELEEIAARESSKKCADQAPTYEAPVYNVLEGPNYDYACPGAVVYDVLEGPDPDSNGIINQGFGPPTYAVLEGPDTTS